ncbi:hypothetical protein [Caldivirga sp. UBA161]|uniref:hypothetical protein n=1 Tax=Caldivirga sp. UBA161 TaxID=1915569 RepID=UPI0025B881D0|nr:hypothetical protein [Caldivirga sp. UBA161]
MAEAAYAPLKMVVCPICNYMGDVKGLKLDYTTVPQPTEVTCPKCGQKVPIESIVTHMRKHLKVGGKNYTCDICQAKVQGEGQAMRHIKEHMIAGFRKGGVMLWVCLACGRVFKYRSSALAHLTAFHERPMN